jgi:hypothetical protein
MKVDETKNWANVPHRIEPSNGDLNCVAGISLPLIVKLGLIAPFLLQKAYCSNNKAVVQNEHDMLEMEKGKIKQKILTKLNSLHHVLVGLALATLIFLTLSLTAFFGTTRGTLPGEMLVMMVSLVFLLAFSLLMKSYFLAQFMRILDTKYLQSTQQAGMLRVLDMFAIDTWLRFNRFSLDFKRVEGLPESPLLAMECKAEQGLIGICSVSPIDQIKQYFKLGLDLIVYEIVSIQAKDRMTDVVYLKQELKQADMLLCEFGLVDVTVAAEKRWAEMFARMEALYEQNHPKGRPEPMLF